MRREQYKYGGGHVKSCNARGSKVSPAARYAVISGHRKGQTLGLWIGCRSAYYAFLRVEKSSNALDFQFCLKTVDTTFAALSIIGITFYGTGERDSCFIFEGLA